MWKTLPQNGSYRVRRALRWMVVVLASLSLHTAAFGQIADAPWPKFGRTLQNSGQSTFGTAGQSWQANVGTAHTAPAIAADGTIHVGAGPFGDVSLYALDPADGSTQWSFTPGNLDANSVQPVVGSDGTVYIGGAGANDNGRLFAVNASGNREWAAFAQGLPVQAAPAIASDGTVFTRFGEIFNDTGEVRAIDPADGSTQWSVDIPYGRSSPTIAAGGTIYLGAADGNLYAIDPVAESATILTTLGGEVSSPAIASDGTIYATDGFAGNVYAIDPATGDSLWRAPTDEFGVTAPVVGPGGTVYVGSAGEVDGAVYAFDPASGNRLWRRGTSGTVDAAPAVASDGTVYALSDAGTNSQLLALNPADGSTRWASNPSGSVEDSPPALAADGTVYFGTVNGMASVLGPVAEITPSSLAFGDVEVGTAPTESLDLANTGDVDLQIDDVSISGADASAFSVVSGGGSGGLGPGQSRDVIVEFAPSSAGAKSATLTVASNAGNETVPLSGTGLAAPAVQTDPATGVTDSEATLNGTVNPNGAQTTVEFEYFPTGNPGATQTVTADQSPLTGTSDQSVSASVSGLDPGVEYTFRVVATNSIGSDTGGDQTFTTSALAPTAQTDPPTDVTAEGATLNGTVDPNGAQTTVTFEYGQDTNYGNTITADQSPLTGDGNQTVSADLSGLEPGTMYHFRTAATNDAGSDTGEDQTFTTDAPGLSVTPPALDFGEVDVGTTADQTVTVTNTGDADLQITGISISGPDAGDFGIVSGGGSGTLAPGETRDVVVRFEPATAGPKSASLVVESDAGNETVDLSGTGVAPTLSINPSSLDFGSVAVNEATDRMVTATNEGSAELQVTNVSVPSGSAFSVVSGGDGGTLAPGESLDVTVRFGPQNAGIKTATLTIESTTGTAQVALSGEGVAVEVSADDDSQTNTDVDITASFSTSGFQPVTAELFYRRGGRAGPQSYQSVPFTDTGDSLSATVPAQDVTLRGLDYYAQFSDGQTTLTFPAGDPAANPAHLRVAVDEHSSPVVPEARTYRMVSVPAALTEPAPGPVLEDDYGPPGPDRWRLLRWDPAAGQYREFPGLDEQFAPGRAFWLITRSGGAFDVEDGRSVDASAPRSIVLQPGWNQIANPFAFPVAWAEVGRPATVEAPIRFDGSGYAAEPAQVLVPWEGYFVYNSGAEPATLSVPPVEAGATNGTNASGTKASATKASATKAPSHTSSARAGREADYTLRLRARHQKLRDTRTVVGFAGGALPGRGPMDAAEPPGIGARRVRLSVIASGGERLDQSLKPAGKAGQWWNLEVGLLLEGAAPPSPRRVTVTLASEAGRLPAGYQRYVFDREAGRRLPLEGRSLSVEVSRERPVRRLRLVLGTPSFAKAHSEGAPLEPVSFGLERNAPNPFGSAEGTRIRYRLGRRCRVDLSVYDVLGRRVATLVAGKEQGAGSHAVRWRGAGRASGVYLYRLRACSFTASRKMILLR